MNTLNRLTLLVFFCFFTLYATDPATINARLGRGLNLANMFDSPSEGDWGGYAQDEYLAAIASKKFQSVRVPIRWAVEARVPSTPPHKINESFLSKVIWVVDKALANGLMVVINDENHLALNRMPDREWERFITVWDTLALRFKRYPDALVYELLSGPGDSLTIDRWNIFINDAIRRIRQKDLTRTIIVGPGDFNDISALSRLQLPDDPNLILGLRFYGSVQYTYQNNAWSFGSNLPLSLATTWDNSDFQKLAMIRSLEYVKHFSTEHKIPVYITEFGNIAFTDQTERQKWTAFTARLFEKFGFSWSYWCFSGNMGIYDMQSGKWSSLITDALLTDTSSVSIKEIPVPLYSPNLITNSTFKNGTVGWSLTKESGDAEFSVINEAGTILIVRRGTTTGSMRLECPVSGLQIGKEYVLQFDAWSDDVRQIGLALVQEESASSGTSNLLMPSIMVTPTSRTFKCSFQMKSTSAQNRIDFIVGQNSTGVINIDNVKLQQMGAVSVSQLPDNTPSINEPSLSSLAWNDNAVTLSVNHSCNALLQIFTNQGRLIGQTSVSLGSGTHAIAIPDFTHRATGVYIARLSIDGVQKAAHRIINEY